MEDKSTRHDLEADEVVTEEQARAYRLAYLQKFTGLTEDESNKLIQTLTQPTSKDWLLERPIRGGKMVKYVPGHRFIQRFNDAFGFLWSYEIPDQFAEDNQIVVKGRWSLQIPGRTVTKKYPDGSEETIRFDGLKIVKEQFGSSEVKKYASDIFEKDRRGNTVKDASGKSVIRYHKGDVIDLGDDYKGAGTDAMKKCGSQLGMFSDIYGPREQEEEAGPTEVQMSAFHKRASDVGMSEEAADKWGEEQLGKKVGEASQQELLGLVADLIQTAKEQKGEQT